MWNLIKNKPELAYAFTMWITAKNGRRFNIGVPAGMTVGELEDQLHERYWSPKTVSTPPATH